MAINNFKTRLEAAQFCDMRNLSRSLVQPSTVDGYKWAVDAPETARVFSAGREDRFGGNLEQDEN